MRKCNGCTICCKYIEVKFPNLLKKAGDECPFQNNGCEIFDRPERPSVCRNFECAWLRGFGEEKERPDIIRNLVSINNLENRNWIISIELDNKVESGIVVDCVKKLHIPAMVFTSYKQYLPDYVIDYDDILLKYSSMCGEFIKELDTDVKLYHHRKKK